MSYNISSENLNNPLLKDLLKELNGFFGSINVDFYVIGATARDIILSNLHDLVPDRKTADLDIAIAISDWGQFQFIEENLPKKEEFEKSKEQRQRFIYKGIYVIDVVPFGDVAKDDGNIYWPPDETIAMSVKERLPKSYRLPSSNIQVLTPMQRGVVGASNLNLALQDALNPTSVSLNRGGYSYRKGDRVMQIRNNYDKGVFNGDLGYIEEVDMEERTLIASFDGTSVEYEVSELDELSLAYATTIHKSQGSEYPIVVMPVLMNHYVMLQRNLIYTGITRAKKICVLIGTTKALAYAIRNLSVLKRNTKLKERLNPSAPKVIPYPEAPEAPYSIAAEDAVPYGNTNK